VAVFDRRSEAVTDTLRPTDGEIVSDGTNERVNVRVDDAETEAKLDLVVVQLI